MHDLTVMDTDSTTLVSQGDSIEEIARHGFEHDEQFLTMLQQVFFMYYNVPRLLKIDGDRPLTSPGQAP